MMKFVKRAIQVRRSVFETNSSSTHSISIQSRRSGTSQLEDALKIVDGVLQVELGEFGWGYDEYYDAEDKMSYLFSQIVATTHYVESETEEEFVAKMRAKIMATDFWKELNENGIKDFVITNKISKETMWNDKSKHYHYYEDTYVDHQSADGPAYILKYSAKNGDTYLDLILKNEYVLIIDNDNH